MSEPKKDCAYCNGTGVDPNSSNCLCMYGMETPSKRTAPTTVRGWIETLPDLSPDSGPSLKSRMMSVCSHFLDRPAKNMLHVTNSIIGSSFADQDSRLFWEGVHEYFRGYKDGFYSSIAADGFLLAKWTMEKASAPAYQVKEVREQTHFTFEGKTLVDNQLLAMLQEKAAKWDELMETIKRLKIC